MALISAFTAIRCFAIFHIILAYLFLTSPATIAEHNVVYILGEATRLPQAGNFMKKSPATGLLSVMFAFVGIIDLTAVSMPEEIAFPFYSSQAPIRVFFLFSLIGYTYIFKKGGVGSVKGASYKPGIGEDLKNGLVFSWAFLELTGWFWVFLTLREERREKARKLIAKRQDEAMRNYAD